MEDPAANTRVLSPIRPERRAPSTGADLARARRTLGYLGAPIAGLLLVSLVSSYGKYPPGPRRAVVTMDGTVAIDPHSRVVTLDLRIGVGARRDARGTVEVTLSGGNWENVVFQEAFQRLPWTKDGRSFTYDDSVEDDLTLSVTLETEAEELVGAAHFEIPRQAYTWTFEEQLEAQEPGFAPVPQPKIGGKPGTQNRPLVQFVDDPTFGTIISFKDAKLKGPADGHDAKRMWMWALQQETQPAFDYRQVDAQEAFWTHPDIPPLPYPFPNASHPTLLKKCACTEGEPYWLFAIVEEEVDGQIVFRGHRGDSSITAQAGAPFHHKMQRGETTTTNGPIALAPPASPSATSPPGAQRSVVTMQGTFDIHPGARVVWMDLEVGVGAPDRQRGTVEVVLYSEDGEWGQVVSREQFQGLPWKNPVRSLRYGEEAVNDLSLSVTLETAEGKLIGKEHFRIPPHPWGWKLDVELAPEGAPYLADPTQPKIGGKPGTQNRPLVQFVVDGNNGLVVKITKESMRLTGPTHGCDPKRMWVWRLEGPTRPSFDDRPDHDNALWAYLDPPIRVPSPLYPTSVHAMNLANATCTEGQTYWLFAVVEEEKDGQLQYRGHRGVGPIQAYEGPSFPHEMEASLTTTPR